MEGHGLQDADLHAEFGEDSEEEINGDLEQRVYEAATNGLTDAALQ